MTDDFEPWLQEFPQGESDLFLKAWQAKLKSMLEDFVLQ